MKGVYPRYKQGEVLLILSRLSPKDKKIFDKFILYCEGTASHNRLKNIRTKILQIRDVSQIPYDKWNLDILRKFLALLNKCDLSKATKNDVKKTLKRFLKEYYEDWSKRFKGLSDIKGENDINQERINANTILNSKDLEKLIRKAESLRLKALIMLMYESGGRPEEILKLRWEDVNLEQGEVKLCSSKNKSVRVNPIKESVLHLQRYYQEYPFTDVQQKDYIFPATTNRREHFSVSYLSQVIGELSKKAIGRRIFPYIIRHTRATELQKVLPPKVYEKFMDHSIETATRYSHLDKNDVREIMLEKIYHIEELTKEEKIEIKKLKEKIKQHDEQIIEVRKLIVSAMANIKQM